MIRMDGCSGWPGIYGSCRSSVTTLELCRKEAQTKKEWYCIIRRAVFNMFNCPNRDQTHCQQLVCRLFIYLVATTCDIWACAGLGPAHNPHFKVFNDWLFIQFSTTWNVRSHWGNSHTARCLHGLSAQLGCLAIIKTWGHGTLVTSK